MLVASSHSKAALRDELEEVLLSVGTAPSFKLVPTGVAAAAAPLVIVATSLASFSFHAASANGVSLTTKAPAA